MPLPTGDELLRQCTKLLAFSFTLKRNLETNPFIEDLIITLGFRKMLFLADTSYGCSLRRGGGSLAIRYDQMCYFWNIESIIQADIGNEYEYFTNSGAGAGKVFEVGAPRRIRRYERIDNTQLMSVRIEPQDLIIARSVLCHCNPLFPNTLCGGIPFTHEGVSTFFKGVANKLNKENQNSLAMLSGDQGDASPIQHAISMFNQEMIATSFFAHFMWIEDEVPAAFVVFIFSKVSPYYDPTKQQQSIF